MDERPSDRPSDDAITRAPKVLLHDHLDGGLRPATVVELAAEYGYDRLPTTDVDALAAWFVGGGKRVDLVQYLEAFDHTVGVMQHRDALARVAQLTGFYQAQGSGPLCPFVFCWPSLGKVIDFGSLFGGGKFTYRSDRDAAQRSGATCGDALLRWSNFAVKVNGGFSPTRSASRTSA